MSGVDRAAPPAPRWTWAVVLAAGCCTLALFLAVPLLETLRNLQVGPRREVREMPLRADPPPPPPPMTLPEPPPASTAPDAAPAPELELPAPPPMLPSAPSLSMPAVFTPGEWTTDPLRVAPVAPAAPEVFDIGELDKPPTPQSQLRPMYPPRARVNRIEGWVDLEFVVTAEGQVENIRVTGSEPEDLFVRSAVQAARRWRFSPGRRQSKAVPVRVRQRITFELQ